MTMSTKFLSYIALCTATSGAIQSTLEVHEAIPPQEYAHTGPKYLGSLIQDCPGIMVDRGVREVTDDSRK
ncbi:hypothetical protein KEM48_001915 [Puccinia striiformis f. sp. tritici PST-130]|nr:hypothetical protein KEM48_001915 [Puccinia striiformis f. sp. tritici PST-130]